MNWIQNLALFKFGGFLCQWISAHLKWDANVWRHLWMFVNTNFADGKCFCCCLEMVTLIALKLRCGRLDWNQSDDGERRNLAKNLVLKHNWRGNHPQNLHVTIIITLLIAYIIVATIIISINIIIFIIILIIIFISICLSAAESGLLSEDIGRVLFKLIFAILLYHFDHHKDYHHHHHHHHHHQHMSVCRRVCSALKGLFTNFFSIVQISYFG